MMATNETAAQMAAIVEDAAKLIRLLREPCDKKGSEDHDWHKCRRCVAGFDIDSRQSYAMRLLDAALVALDAQAAALRAQAQPMTQVLAIGLCPECGPVSAVDVERCCTGCGADVGMFDRPTMVTTADLRAQAQGPAQDVELRALRDRMIAAVETHVARFECGTGGCGDPEYSECCGTHGEMQQAKSGEWVRLDDVLDAISYSAVSATPAQGWQPIETAPKDGTQVLLRMSDASQSVTIGRWDGPYWSTERGYLFGRTWDRGSQPTHWHPLPPGPRP